MNQILSTVYLESTEIKKILYRIRKLVSLMYPSVALIFESTQLTRTRAVETDPAGTSL